MFLVLKLSKWENVDLEQSGVYRLPFPSHLEAPGNGSIGYCEVFDTRENAQKVYGELLDGPGRYQKAREAISLRLGKWHIYVSPEELRILIESILIELQEKFGDKWYELSARTPQA